MKKPAAAVHTVRLEPVGVEMQVEEGETVLDAAFRQGVALPHGCKEGQCSACKCILNEGDVEMLKYSTFALSDPERENGQILLCRTLVYSDIEVELLNFDEEELSRSIAVKEFNGRLAKVEPLTHDIVRIAVELDEPMKFWAGQFADLTLVEAGITRSYSMGNPPSDPSRLEFIIKKYPGGAFSTAIGAAQIGARITVKGPYGSCSRRENRDGPMILVGGGSGMAPLLSILKDQAASGETRPVRFYYGARTVKDLFELDVFAEFEASMPDFKFIPALSHAEEGDGWTGEVGFIHDVLRRHIMTMDDIENADAYGCGPPVMIDSATPVMQIAGIDSARMYFDKFTPATSE
ncbi:MULTISPECIES: NADH:ubiquinone reductase (Na(+)-transporting) subunit F [unclassified Novosphingobium]|nr:MULTISPECIES: 2Fe-2S iron-sulfur cluster binding domain-containing protein [unclassified Novosphingobium]MDR6708667.1 propane monooxygenase reductase subunit [Novosphingobium sp. 1748]